VNFVRLLSAKVRDLTAERHDAGKAAAKIDKGRLLLPLSKSGKIAGDELSDWAIWSVVEAAGYTVFLGWSFLPQRRPWLRSRFHECDLASSGKHPQLGGRRQ
jgi:hypothetical protein